ncbi:hypothetical protein VISP3789_07559 [Vibrio splendidus ATCC 33789]|nr:hypothetical protein VISP3789_07559 [Vibrio splendidus ATCC 33789]
MDISCEMIKGNARVNIFFMSASVNFDQNTIDGTSVQLINLRL